MADELKHVATAGGTTLAQTDWEDVDIHRFDSQAEGDILYASSATQLSRLAKGSDGEVLELASGIPSWVAKFQDFVGCASKDGFTLIETGSGGAMPQGACWYFVAGPSTNNHAHLRTTNTWQSLVANGKLLTVEWVIAYVMSVATVTRRVYMLAGGGTIPPDDTDSHFGFKIINADIYATNADGANQRVTDTAVNLSTGGQMTRLKAVVDRATNIKFYVDGVLKVTHTDRFPAQGAYNWVAGLVVDDNVDRDMYLGRTLIERKY